MTGQGTQCVAPADTALPLWARPAMRQASAHMWRPGGLYLTDRIAELAGLRSGWRVLDVGCGCGASVLHLRRRYGAKAVGVDLLAGHTPFEAASENAPQACASDRTASPEPCNRAEKNTLEHIQSCGRQAHAAQYEASKAIVTEAAQANIAADGIDQLQHKAAASHSARVVTATTPADSASCSNTKPSVPATAPAMRPLQRIPLVRADAMHLPFAPASFDMLISECVTSLLPDVPTALRGFRSLLRDGGILALSDLYLRSGTTSPLPAGSCLGWSATKDDIITMLEMAGFRVLVFEDHSSRLGELAARLIFAGESPCTLAGTGAACTGGNAQTTPQQSTPQQSKAGYFLLIAQA